MGQVHLLESKFIVNDDLDDTKFCVFVRDNHTSKCL